MSLWVVSSVVLLGQEVYDGLKVLLYKEVSLQGVVCGRLVLSTHICMALQR